MKMRASHSISRALRLVVLWLSLLWVSSSASSFMLPSVISLRAGVLHAPPFAVVDTTTTGTSTTKFSGFQVDMLHRLQAFAAQDNVTLEFTLSQSPTQYADAFDLVASDCHTIATINNSSRCDELDLIVGDFYGTDERSMRADFTPAWLRTTMSTVKYLDKKSRDFTTLADAAAAEATVCVQDGTYIKTVIQARFPQANYTLCPSLEDCFQALQNEECVLYVDDELALRYRAAVDPSLELTREQFNSQYLMWPMREDLPPLVAKLIKKWMYRAIGNATMDQLYKTYFEKHTCPHGTAGEHCELPCDPDHGTADATGACICHSTKWTGFDCSMEVPEELNLIPESLVRTGYALAGINVCLVLFCAVWLCWQRRRAQVQMAQPSFLSLILLGCLISTSTIIDMAQQDAGDGPVYACMAIPWGYSVGFCITFGALFARIRRVYILVKSAAQMKRVRVSVMETLQIVGGVLLIDVSILVVWSAVDPLRWNRQVISEDQFGNALESVGSCGSEHWAIFAGIIAVFHLLLMSGACYMCFVSRKIPDRVSNGKFVGIAMVSNFQILLCAAPILLVLGSDPVANFVVRSVAIFMNDFVVVCLVFGPLVFKVKRFDHQTRRAVIRINSQEPINDGIKHYAQRVGRKRTEKERRRLMEQRAQRVTEITVVETSAEPMDQSSEQARSEDGLGGHAMPEPLPSEAQDLSMKVEEDALAEEEEEIVFESFSAESMDEGLLDSDDEEGNGSLSSCLQEDSDPKEPLADSGDCMYSCTAELDASFESESCSVPSNDIEDGRNHDDEVQDSRETPTAREP